MIPEPHFESYEETIAFLDESADELWDLECEYEGIVVEDESDNQASDSR